MSRNFQVQAGRRGELASVGARDNLFNIADDHPRDGELALGVSRRLHVQNRHNVSTLRLLFGYKRNPAGVRFPILPTATFYIHRG